MVRTRPTSKPTKMSAVSRFRLVSTLHTETFLCGTGIDAVGAPPPHFHNVDADLFLQKAEEHINVLKHRYSTDTRSIAHEGSIDSRDYTGFLEHRIARERTNDDDPVWSLRVSVS